MLQLQLPEDIEDRLDLLSLGSGHTRQYYVLEAVLEYLDDIEDRQRRIHSATGSGEQRRK